MKPTYFAFCTAFVALTWCVATPADEREHGDAPDPAEKRFVDREVHKLEPKDLAPLAHVFAHIHGRFPGKVLKVEIEREVVSGRNVWLYEVKLLTPQGDVLKLRYDAQTLRLVSRRGHGRYGDIEEHLEGDEHDDGKDGHGEKM